MPQISVIKVFKIQRYSIHHKHRSIFQDKEIWRRGALYFILMGITL